MRNFPHLLPQIHFYCPINHRNQQNDARTLQYFETLKQIGASPSTKYIFPLEFTSLLGNFLGGDGKK